MVAAEQVTERIEVTSSIGAKLLVQYERSDYLLKAMFLRVKTMFVRVKFMLLG